VENLKPSARWGCRQNLRHSTVIESWLTLMPITRRSQFASRRLNQCVTPAARSDSGGGVTAAARISQTTSSVSTRAEWVAGRVRAGYEGTDEARPGVSWYSRITL